MSQLAHRHRLFTDDQRRMIAQLADWSCAVCRNPLGDIWHAHHIVSYEDGGATDVFNGAPVCPSCHKHAERCREELEHWAAEQRTRRVRQEEQLTRYRREAVMPTNGEFTLSQAAEYCDVSLISIRKRADRGHLPTIKRDGIRYVTLQALEDSGLVAGSEVRQLKRKVAALEEEIAAHRQLAVGAQAEAAAEREGHERVTRALVEQRAIAATAQERLDALEQQLATAGPIRAWRLARARRNQQED